MFYLSYKLTRIAPRNHKFCVDMYVYRTQCVFSQACASCEVNEAYRYVSDYVLQWESLVITIAAILWYEGHCQCQLLSYCILLHHVLEINNYITPCDDRCVMNSTRGCTYWVLLFFLIHVCYCFDWAVYRLANLLTYSFLVIQILRRKISR